MGERVSDLVQNANMDSNYMSKINFITLLFEIKFFTSNLLQRLAPKSKEVEKFSCVMFEFTHRFGPLPFPRLHAGNHGHLHLLHLPVMDTSLKLFHDSGGTI